MTKKERRKKREEKRGEGTDNKYFTPMSDEGTPWNMAPPKYSKNPKVLSSSSSPSSLHPMPANHDVLV